MQHAGYSVNRPSMLGRKLNKMTRNDQTAQTLSVRGRYIGRTTIPDGPLPDAEGTAELVITPSSPQTRGSVADAFGRAPVLRSGEDILAQAQANRDEWSDR